MTLSLGVLVAARTLPAEMKLVHQSMLDLLIDIFVVIAAIESQQKHRTSHCTVYIQLAIGQNGNLCLPLIHIHINTAIHRFCQMNVVCFVGSISQNCKIRRM